MKSGRIAKRAFNGTNPLGLTNLLAVLGCFWANWAPAADPPRRPANFKPFQYEYTTEQLAGKFSQDQMGRAAEAWKEMQAVNEKGPWKPTWESLDKHQTPEWFCDAKLGIMINWGLHSVPAHGIYDWRVTSGPGPFYPDLYGNYSNSRTHLDQFYGTDFHYDDFFPMFRAEQYDPNVWVNLFREAGARYIVTMSKHHDGVAWWDSAWTKRNFAQMGPKRDLLAPLVEAARRQGLKTTLYFCFEEYASVVLDPKGQPIVRIWGCDPKPSEPLSDGNRRRVSGFVPVSNFYDQYMMPLVKEMVDRFDPDGFWMDADWTNPAKTLRSRELAAYFYNKTNGRKEVYMDDRFGGVRGEKGDVYIDEYRMAKGCPWLNHPWSECTTMSRSFAYNRDATEAYMSPVDLVHLFIDIISQNGNLELIMGPDASGRWPQPAVERLKALGAWIKANAEAVYGTRSLAPYHELVRAAWYFNGAEVCYTRSKDGKYAYAICKQWPGRALTLKGVRAVKGSTITMLGVEQPLKWEQDPQGLQGLYIDLPETLQNETARPCKYAWVVKILLEPHKEKMSK